MMLADHLPVPGEQLIPLLERKRLFDGAWLVCLVATFGAVATLWFISVLNIDLTRVAWSVFGYGLAYLIGAAASDRLGSARALSWSMRAMMVASLVFLGIFWHQVGGLHNPMFLVAFTVPVMISGIMAVGLQAHLTALLSIVVVVVVAAGESPDLRWYLGRLHVWIPDAFAASTDGMSGRVPVFAGVILEPAYEFTVIATFAFMQLILAFVSTPLTALLLRINGRFETSKRLLNEVQGLFHAVLSAVPNPGVIVYTDSGQVVQASDSFFHRMMLRPSQLLGKGLFEIIDFDEPERVRKQLEARHGEIPFCVYRVGPEERIANVSFYQTEHAGIGYRYLGWQELTDVYYLQAAFTAMREPLLVIGKSGRLHYANEAARGLFGALHFGMQCDAVPVVLALLNEDHDDGSRDGQPARHEIGGAAYAVSRVVATLPNGGEACTILWLHSLAREDALFDQAVRDPLTGIYNRRYFDEVMIGQVERSHRGQQVALAYFDLDDFKGVNDGLGHAAGDAALRTFVAAVKSQLRETDVFARRGGDEFAVLFVDCSTDVAVAAIERLRGVLASSGCVFEDKTFPIHFSVGLAACRPSDNVERLIARADRALYDIKESGKGGLGVAE